jgi:hypothetical protein
VEDQVQEDKRASVKLEVEDEDENKEKWEWKWKSYQIESLIKEKQKQ